MENKHAELEKDYPEFNIKPLDEKYDDTEKDPRCRLCGYKLTDPEIFFYRQVSGIMPGKFNKEIYSYYCVFCYPFPDEARDSFWLNVRFLLTQRIDLYIHRVKCRIRDFYYNSDEAKALETDLKLLIEAHEKLIFPKEYSELKNDFQKLHESKKEELKDIKMLSRHLYFGALGELGARYSRDLSKKKKLILLKALNASYVVLKK